MQSIDRQASTVLEAFLKENPTAFDQNLLKNAVEECVTMVDSEGNKPPMPADGELEGLGLEVMKFAQPEEGDYFLQIDGTIGGPETDVAFFDNAGDEVDDDSDDAWQGYRFILKAKSNDSRLV